MARRAALEDVASEDAQAREARVIRVVRVGRPVARQTHRIGRKIDLDQVGDEDRRDVGAIRVRRRRQRVRLQNEPVDERCQLRVHGVFAEDYVVNARQRSAISVFIIDRDQSLVEERVALTGHLRKGGATDQVEDAATVGGLRGQRQTTGRRKYADGLLVAADLAQRNPQRDQMNVESALGVFARITQLEQVENRLNIA